MNPPDTTTEVIAALQAGTRCSCRITYSYDATADEYAMTIDCPGIRPETFVRGDLFQCLCDAREFVRGHDTILLCNGARLDAYPSRMSRQMSGGLSIYISTMGRPNRETDMVELFSEAPPDKIASVADQKEFHRNWLRSLGMDV